jgi:predicted nucleotidyltransferase
MTLTDDRIAKLAARGDPIHAWYSYRMIRETLGSAKLDGLSYVIYPQGSYANKTNISADSDVDLVIALRSAFFANKEELTQRELEEYEKYYQQASITWRRFREVVVDLLRSWYFVEEKSKCVKVRSNLIRLPADVLVALDHRHYKAFPGFFEQIHIDGVQFYTLDEVKIINFPREHIQACKNKNDLVSGHYRPVVRIAKNVRNMLIADDKTGLSAGSAPSYFLESLLWNVPDQCFRDNLPQAYRNVVRWLRENPDKLADMKFPNQMATLFGQAQDSVWKQSAALALIEALQSA